MGLDLSGLGDWAKRNGVVPASTTSLNLRPQMPLSDEDKSRFGSQPVGLPEDWDYKSSARGPDGQELPRGAIGWTPQGEAFYGGESAIANWWNGLASRFAAPSEKGLTGADYAADAIHALLGENQYKEADLGQRAAGVFGNAISAFDTAFKGFGVDDVGNPTPLTYVSRGVSEGIGGALALAGQAAEEVEKISGGLIEAAGGELNPLDEFLKNTTKEWEGGWANLARGLIFGAARIPGIAIDAARALVNPVANKAERFNEGYNAGRILYSQFIDPAVREEYMRRFRAGENPYLLAEELQNPIAEMGGEIIADPLNFVGLIAKGGRVAKWAAEGTKYFTEVFDGGTDIANLVKAGRAVDAVEAGERAAQLVSKIPSWSDNLTAVVKKVDDKLTSLTAEAKRVGLAGRNGTYAWSMITAQGKEAGWVDNVLDVFKAHIDLHSGNADKITEALSVFQKRGVPLEMALSQAGGEFGIVLKQVIGDSPAKFLEDLAKADTPELIMEKFGKRIDGAIDTLIPTFAQRAKSGEVLSTRARAIMAAEKLGNSGVYKSSRKFFGSLYMGYNPGYAARNITSNYLHLFIDEGLGTVVQNGRLFTPTRASDFIKSALGRIPEDAARGLGATEGIAGGFAAKWGSRAEEGASLQVFAKSLRDNLRKGYDTIFTDLGEDLARSGFTDGDIQLMRTVMGETHDVAAVRAKMAALYNAGYVNVFDEFEWIDASLATKLDNYGNNPVMAYKDAIRGHTSLEDALQRSNKFFQEHFEDYAKAAALEPPGIPQDVLDNARSLAGEATGQGYLSDTTLALSNSQKNANLAAENGFWDVVEETRKVAKRLGPEIEAQYNDILKKIPNSDAVFGKKMLNEVVNGFNVWADGTKAKFYDLLDSGKLTLEQVARQVGIADPLPANMNKAQLRQYFWEAYFIPSERNYFNQAKRSYVGIAQQIIDESKKLDPRLVNGSKYETALKSLHESILWENASIDAATGLGIAGARTEVDAIRKLGILNGIASKATGGANLDEALLRAINKYVPEGAKKLTSLTDEGAYEAAKAALQARAESKGVEFVANVGDASFAKRGLADSLIPPWSGDAPVSPTRMVAEQLGGLREMRGTFEKAITENYGKTRAIYKNSNIETALGKFEQLAKPRVQQLKVVAERTAKATRDFALLDYSQRKNFDVFLGLIYPYHYWHSRTYVNWLKRAVSDPGIIAAYSKYRDTLAEIHAGAPDWWKYNVNTNELFGLDSENPMYFNLEATLNPLNGLTGVDFNDPYKRVNWWTAAIDDLGKLGPSPWTMISMATALALRMQGEDDAASRWAGRLIPQTQTLQSVGSLAGLDPFELDPFVNIFSNGIDPYTRKRVGRALGTLVLEGKYSEDQAADAAYSQSGEIWNEAWSRAINERAWGQISSQFLGVGFKGRSAGDLQSDQFYQDYFRLLNLRDTMSPEQFRTEMDGIRQAYPFMDSLLISRQGGEERDTALAYNVLNRLPPGGSSLTQKIGIDSRLLSQFYDTKGDWSKWRESDKDRFMAGVIDLMGVLATPADATRQEWTLVRNAYTGMNDALKQQYGADILEGIDEFYRLNAESSEAGQAFLRTNPAVNAAMDARSKYIATTPLLTTYYGGLEAVERYYKNLMYSDIEAQMGDIWSRFSNNTASAADRKKYAKLRDQWLAQIDASILRIGSTMPEAKGVELRTDIGDTSTFQQDFIESLQPPMISEVEVIDRIGETGFAILQDFLQTQRTLPYSLRQELNDLAKERGVSFYELLQLIQQPNVIQ